MSQRTYTTEFKIEAVNLANKIGGAKAAEQLGISSKNVYRWTKELSVKDSKKVHTNDLSQEQMKRKIKKLEKELLYMKKINEVLKKSTAIFSNDQMPRL
ncbi:MAG: transposase [Bacteriovoracaceae bacterium]|jgi:transposase